MNNLPWTGQSRQVWEICPSYQQQMEKPSSVLSAYFSLRNLGILPTHSKPGKGTQWKGQKKRKMCRNGSCKSQRDQRLVNTAHSHPHFIRVIAWHTYLFYRVLLCLFERENSQLTSHYLYRCSEKYLKGNSAAVKYILVH